ncbi:2-octaprenyl-3-methyl-6-methoxy-1,4-benzoquinol hydroxylase [Roseibium hamelinense]|uniref:2-octaprenyl-3-methyl-6-methoxy-1,4-benzoquinol hydroxylase n=1 Tax=Roseibium hamelinense TaxID=150831 RepID=A0A562SPB5_9HYPH|nr:ubiquinone biosynthesis hydroxylase [Roseibium hamelinense]MTI44019.1 ubiquinone biosynthesis hydroxylase [Roseibium hamelinense]TWI82774.1 2-octaprenyl-3-methyl-6-methoxy-1,4-benzoquinol hydroxylase [Roseibium hamelinense]
MANANNADQRFDVVIAGGGYVGLSLSLALQKADPALSVAVVDPKPMDQLASDPRASAIAAAASRMLDQLGLWSELLPSAQPINEMIVTDSKLRDVVRPVFLTFDGEVTKGEPFAHMVPNGKMMPALHNAAKALGVQFFALDTALTFRSETTKTLVQLKSGASIEARLLVAADGVRSKLRSLAGIKTVHWDYGQSGIVTMVKHERPHDGRAEEHFLPAGPFAILPLPGNRSSLVWTEKTADAERLVKSDDFTFELELERRFGHHLGKIELGGPKNAYPLGLTLAREFVRPRFALIGDAAHGIHPIAGQGLNLGFKDVAALAEVIVDARRLGQDIGSSDVLERYQRWRRFDTLQMGIVTDVLNRLFSNDNDMLRAVRDFGLGLVDRMPGLKSQFISEASGFAGPAPKLLSGEPI